MRLNELINLPVFTQSGQKLGKVFDLEIDPMTGQVLEYFVKSDNLVKKILQEQLIIHHRQVISLDKEKMVVEDNVAKKQARVLQKAKLVVEG